MNGLNRFQQELDKEITALNFPDNPDELYAPLTYTLALSGKRIRPLLALLGAHLFGGKQEDAMPVALAIELFHNFTLIHDDIMDDAPIRRGQPSVYNKWGANVAILSGDALLIKAYEQLAKAGGNVLPQLLSLFNTTALEVCEGQQMDMNFERENDVKWLDYLKMIELKTAVLLGTSLKMGALSAGASVKDADLLYQFGKDIGIAFQLQDDWLDVFGDHQKVGKQEGGDIIAGKKTVLFFKAMELANSEEKATLLNTMQATTIDDASRVNTVKALYDKLEVGRLVKEEMDVHFNNAMKNLKACSAAEEKQALLHDLAVTLMSREA